MESIKRFFTAIFLVCGFALHAANPAYESFKGTNNIVLTTPGVGAARLVVFSGHLLQPASTNLTNWSNIPTNALSFSQIWTNDAGTVYLVPTDVFEVFTTNLNNEGVLYSIGPLTLGSTSMILSLGTNDVDTSQQSDRVMTSPTNNAALVTLRLSPPTVGAQLLFISNGDTNTAWTIVDGQTNTTGGGAVDTQGDFVANAPGIGLLLKAAGEDWIEIGRFDPGGLAPGAMNPTDNFIPYRDNATSFRDSPFVLRGGIAHVTNQTATGTAELLFQTTNQLVRLGPDGPATTFLRTSGILSLIGTNGASLAALGNNSVSLVQNTNTLWFIDQKFYPQLSNRYSLGSPTEPWKDFYVGTNSIFMGTNVYTDNGSDLLRNGVAVGGGGSGPSFADLVWTNNADVIETLAYGTALQFNPGVADGGVPILFDLQSTNVLTDDDTRLIRVRNGPSTAFQVSRNGGIAIGANVVSVMGGLPTGGSTFWSVRDVTAGDDNFNQVSILTVPSAGQFRQADLTLDSTSAQLNLQDETATSNALQAQARNGSTFIKLTANGSTRMNLVPTAAATATAYEFDTSVAHTSGAMVDFQNLNVSQFTVNPTNGVSTLQITAYGAGSHPWQFGMATNTVDVLLRATNMVEITVNGVAYYLPAALK